MKKILFLLIILSANSMFSQKSSDQRDVLLNTIKTYQDSINLVNDYHQNKMATYKDTIKSLQHRINTLIAEEGSNDDSDTLLIGIVKYGAIIKEKPESLSDILFEFDEFDKLVLLDYNNEYFKVCKDSICGYISQVWMEPSNEIDAYISAKKTELQEIENQKTKEDANILLPEYGNILIQEMRVIRGDSTAGVGLKIKFRYLNYSKTIKYLFVTVVPYNAVGDVQMSATGGQSVFTGRIAGPIEADVINTNSTYWENAWNSNTVTCVKITKVKVEYVDGSTHTYIDEIPKILASNIVNDCNSEN